jgi:hypothetical protein
MLAAILSAQNTMNECSIIAAKTATIYMGPPEPVGAFGNWDKKFARPYAVLSDRHHKGVLTVNPFLLTTSTAPPSLCRFVLHRDRS